MSSATCLGSTTHSAVGLRCVVALMWAMFGSAISLWAGDWHVGRKGLHCSDCHIMHASYEGIPFGGGPVAPTGYPKLLRAATVSDLCLTCHDGGSGSQDSAPDVMGAISYETNSLKCAGGAFQATVGASSPNGHDLGVPNQTAPGGTWSSGIGMSCITCHAPHGNEYYRNLVPLPGSATSNRGVTAVEQTVITPTAEQYSVGNISYTGSSGGLSRWCQGCHINFHGSPGDPALGGSPGGDTPGSNNYWLRHPTEGITIAQGVANGHIDADFWFTAARSRIPVVSPSGVIPGNAATSDNEVFCGSCHKAHGSSHRAALIWDDPTTDALEDGVSARDTCQTCHYM